MCKNQYYFLENNENATLRMTMYLLCNEHNNEGMNVMEKCAKFEFILCVGFQKKLIKNSLISFTMSYIHSNMSSVLFYPFGAGKMI